MTIPLWTPFMFLAGVCAVFPLPAWARRVDWPVLVFWASYLVLYGLTVFALVRVAS